MSFHGRDEHGHTEDTWHPQVKRHRMGEENYPNTRIKFSKTEIREISFHGTLCRVLGNCHQILFTLGHIFPTISINEDLVLILAYELDETEDQMFSIRVFDYAKYKIIREHPYDSTI